VQANRAIEVFENKVLHSGGDSAYNIGNWRWAECLAPFILLDEVAAAGVRTVAALILKGPVDDQPAPFCGLADEALASIWPSSFASGSRCPRGFFSQRWHQRNKFPIFGITNNWDEVAAFDYTLEVDRLMGERPAEAEIVH
jgi:hypothetical protein